MSCPVPLFWTGEPRSHPPTSALAGHWVFLPNRLLIFRTTFQQISCGLLKRISNPGQRQGNSHFGSLQQSMRPQPRPPKKGPSRLGRGLQPQAIRQSQLPAESFMATVKPTTAIKPTIPVKAPITAVSIPHHRAPIPHAHVVPVPRNPIAVGHVPANPRISRARAGRNISHRSANTKSKLGRLRRRRSHGRHASHHCRS